MARVGSGLFSHVMELDVLEIALEEQRRARGILPDLGPCKVVLSRATTSFGVFSVELRDPAKSGSAEIRISRYITSEEQVRETARHELAHQAAWERYGDIGHGPYWQTFASYLGCAPVACSSVEMDPAVIGARVKYEVSCEECGWATKRQKRSKLVRVPWRFSCARCGGRLRVAKLS